MASVFKELQVGSISTNYSIFDGYAGNNDPMFTKLRHIKLAQVFDSDESGHRHIADEFVPNWDVTNGAVPEYFRVRSKVSDKLWRVQKLVNSIGANLVSNKNGYYSVTEVEDFTIGSGGGGTLPPGTVINGLSAYEIAVQQGFVGTEPEWLESLKGLNGTSSYSSWLANGNTGTESDFLDSLVGAQGDSAYTLALDNGFIGTEQEWLESLEGRDGDSIQDATVNLDGDLVITQVSGTQTNAGRVTGLSAYEVWLSEGNVGTEDDFLEWLRASVVFQGGNVAIDFAGSTPTVSGFNALQTKEIPLNSVTGSLDAEYSSIPTSDSNYDGQDAKTYVISLADNLLLPNKVVNQLQTFNLHFTYTNKGGFNDENASVFITITEYDGTALSRSWSVEQNCGDGSREGSFMSTFTVPCHSGMMSATAGYKLSITSKRADGNFTFNLNRIERLSI